MDKPSLDQVRTVIDALYNGSNTENKEQASQWLGQLQTSVSFQSFSSVLTVTQLYMLINYIRII